MKTIFLVLTFLFSFSSAAMAEETLSLSPVAIEKLQEIEEKYSGVYTLEYFEEMGRLIVHDQCGQKLAGARKNASAKKNRYAKCVANLEKKANRRS